MLASRLTQTASRRRKTNIRLQITDIRGFLMAIEAQNIPNHPYSPTLYAVSYTLFPIRNTLHILSSVFCLLSSVLTNKPNFQKSQMNLNLYNTTDYENKWQQIVRKNKPNSNPNKPNFQKAKMNINSLITKDYRKKDDFAVRINKPNSNPISQRVKIDAKCVFTKDYEEKYG